jgi:hypothetical protein
VAFGVLATMLGLAIFCIVALITTGDGSQPRDDFSATVAKSNQRESSAREAHERIEPKWETPWEQDRHSDAGTPETDAAPAEAAEDAVDAEPAATSPFESTAQEAATASEPRPLDGVRQRGNRLELPSPSDATGPIDLTTIYVDSVENCSLDIVGEEAVLKGAVFKIVDDLPQDKMRNWRVIKQPSGIGRSVPVGVFSLDGQTLSFAWDQFHHGAELRNCILRITAKNSFGSDEASCILREPEPHSGLEINFDSKMDDLKLLSKDELQDTTNVRLDFSLSDDLSNQLRITGKKFLRVGESSTIELVEDPDPSRAADESFRVEIKLTLLSSDTDNTVYLRRETFLRWKEFDIPDSVSPNANTVLKQPVVKIQNEAFTYRLLAAIEKQAEDNASRIPKWFDALKNRRTRNRKQRAGENRKTKKGLDALMQLDQEYRKLENLMRDLPQMWKVCQGIPQRITKLEKLLRRVERDVAIQFKLMNDISGSGGPPVVLVESTSE